MSEKEKKECGNIRKKNKWRNIMKGKNKSKEAELEKEKRKERK